ncbi:MAG: hypothetical protein ACFB16_11340 [Phormidesmis sp.]
MHSDQISQITASDLQVMSSEWRVKLHQAATKVNAKEVSHLLEEIPLEQRPLKHYIQQLVENFDFEKIVDLTS